MEKRRRAEKLVALLRWFVLVLGSVVISDSVDASRVAILASVLGVYNAFVTFCTFSAARFAKCGRRLSDICRLIDTAAISLVLAVFANSESVAWLLYWFVLVSSGYSNASLRRLAYDSATVLSANALATLYAASVNDLPLTQVVYVLSIRSVGIIMGALVAAYVAKVRSQDELVSERGCYLQAILDCGTKLTRFRDVRELAVYVLQSAVTQSGAQGGELLLINDETNEMEREAFHSLAGESADVQVPPESLIRSYANWVLSTGKEFIVKSSVTSEEQTSSSASSFERDNHHAIAVPLQWQSSGADNEVSVLGVLVVWSAPGEDFAPDALDILKIFAAIAGAAIVNLKLYTTLQKSFLRTLQSLAASLEARDEYTRGHSERVMKVALMIAEELGVPSESMEVLRSAAELHDIGKIGVPDAILRKAGKLTAEEWETMRRHPIVSEEICRPLGLPDEVLFLIKHHHERIDGKGYPAGLPPEQQPLLQRILVVADCFDAMRSRRPYRDVMSEEELLSELNRSAGRTMDPTVVEALKRLMDRGDLVPIYAEHDRLTGISVRPSRENSKAA